MKLPADLERLGVLDELIEAWEANCGEASDRTGGPRPASRCCAGSLAELMMGDVQNGEAPTLLRELMAPRPLGCLL
jgi:hypothetical protein